MTLSHSRNSRAERFDFIRLQMDRMISADGRSGRIRQLIASGCPVTLLTHWQSLHTQGAGLGLEEMTTLLERIQKAFGVELEWVTCAGQARRFGAASTPHRQP